MKNKYNNVVEKFLFYIPVLTFVLYTSVHNVFAMRSNSDFISFIIEILNMFYMKGSYIFLLISLALAIYVLINGNTKHKLITVATILGSFLMCFNLNRESIDNGIFLTVLLFVSSYLMGILYILAISIYTKGKDTTDIKNKIIKSAKAVVIYVGIIFLLAIISNTNQYSYVTEEQGLTAWIKSTNALGHALVFLLPLFVLLYIQDKKYNYLFYIIVIATLDLLIGTKACYYGLLSTLFVSIIYLIIDSLRNKKYHIYKLLSLIVILIISLVVSSNLYVRKNIDMSIKQNTNEQGRLDVINFVTSGRIENVKIINPVFNKSKPIVKIFGLGLYYPKYDFIYVEFDLLDILYSRGIYGLILYFSFFGTIIFKIFKKVFDSIKNKKFNINYLLMLLTIGYIAFASLLVGHVAFNLMTITVAVIVIYGYIFIIRKIEEPEIVRKGKKKNLLKGR